jgi:hypothetical protein
MVEQLLDKYRLKPEDQEVSGDNKIVLRDIS